MRTTNNLLSAADLASMNLACLPATRQAVEHRAKKQGWPVEWQDGIGRGGKKRMYPLTGLPPEIQTAIREKQAAEILSRADQLPVAVVGNPPAAKPKKLGVALRREAQLMIPLDDLMKGYTQKQKDCAHARMALASAVLHIHRVAGLALKPAIALLIERIETGTADAVLVAAVPLANARSGGKAKLSARSLMGWVQDYKHGQTPAERLALLAPKTTKQETPIMAYGWLPHFAKVHCIPSAPSLSESYRVFAAAWQREQRPEQLPTLRQVTRVWGKLPMIMQERGRKTGAAYKAILPYVKRDWDALNPNDVWIGDGHSFKAKVAHPLHGRPFKPEVTVLIDGCSRMVMGFSVSLAESCVAVADGLRIGIKHFGVPLMYYSDNGAGQTGKTIDHEITGLTARLGIHHETGLPGNPQGRGIIERWWQDNLIALARQYETFVGAGMDSSTQSLIYRKMESAFNALDKGKALTDEQQRYLQKLPSWSRFIADVAACIDAYNARPHSELPKKADGSRYTPAEYRDKRLADGGITPDYLSQQELDMLFMPQEIRKVQRGWIDLFTNQYFSEDLAQYHKDEVRVAYDLDDAQTVVVYDLDGKFLTKAKLNGNKRSAFPLSRRDQLAEQRAQGRIKRSEQAIALAKAELNPALEQAAALDELFGAQWRQASGSDVLMSRPLVARDDDIVLFKTDLEEE
ncbi:bacteriophage transposase [Bergeriella denitrificans]|uniref:Bacteriophage transposase n=1 Tax=Bergeriella denitrificans TaxID=494 RepID=A0A378UDQ1_BERDE|nr:bacteriophage transposase [Bergeriella denitrificans]